MRCLRPDRQAAVPRRRRRRLPAVQGLAAGCCLRGLRQGQARLRPRRQPASRSARCAAARGPAATGLRVLRQDRAGRGPRPRRPAGHLRELLPDARQRPAAYAGGYVPASSPRPASRSASSAPRGQPRSAPAAARTARRRPAGPKDRSATPCYTAALRRRVRCASCGQMRRLVSPPGPDADTCAGCAGLPVTSVCADCGTEDKMFEKHRCARCSLRRRAAALLSGRNGQVPGELAAVLTAICSARNPRTALNWLRAGAGAAILADLAAGRIAATHQALDQHPGRAPPATCGRCSSPAAVLPPRDEELARAEQWLAGLLASMTVPEHRRLVRAYATWQVILRLRRSSRARRRPRTYTARARNKISAPRGSSAGSAHAAPPCPPAARPTSTTG